MIPNPQSKSSVSLYTFIPILHSFLPLSGTKVHLGIEICHFSTISWQHHYLNVLL